MVTAQSSWDEKFTAAEEIMAVDEEEEAFSKEIYDQLVSYHRQKYPGGRMPVKELIGEPDKSVEDSLYQRVVDRAIEKGKTKYIGETLIRKGDYILFTGTLAGTMWERDMLVWKIGDEDTYVLTSQGLVGKYEGPLYKNLGHAGNTGSFSGIPIRHLEKLKWTSPVTDMGAKLVNREKAAEIAGVVKQVFPFAEIPLDTKLYDLLNK